VKGRKIEMDAPGAAGFRRWRTAFGAWAGRGDLLTWGVMYAALALLAANALSLLGRLAGWSRLVDGSFVVALLLNLALLMLARARLREMRIALAEGREASAAAISPATRDPLTELPNRAGFSAAGAALIAGADDADTPVVLIAVDLDRFTEINDTHGHAVGDALLVEVAQAIVAQLPEAALIARVDGDGFACLVPGDARLGATLADRLARRLAQPPKGVAAGSPVTASVGFAARDAGSGVDIEALLQKADAALTSAKRQGGNRTVRYGPILERAVALRAAIETDLRAGIAKGEFVPFYQMQIDLETGALQGFEVLARWYHPTRGLVAPDEFLPVAELAGLTGALSTTIMRAAFEEARSWNQMLMLTVNVSRSQLHDPWFAQKLLRLLLECEFPPERLELDIPEEAIEGNLPLARSLADSLRRHGVRLAFDNFGTGQCSLAHIRALPFDRIKLDRSVVQAMGQDRDSDAVVAAVATLTANLGLPVVVGGIADETIRKRVAALGFKNGQGWHLGKPFAVDSARALLAERGLLAAPSVPPMRAAGRAG